VTQAVAKLAVPPQTDPKIPASAVTIGASMVTPRVGREYAPSAR